MPELPEVETIRRDLVSQILGLKITMVQIFNAKTVQTPEPVFLKLVKNNYFKKIDRIGKLLILELGPKKISGQSSVNYYLLIHLKMTGQLIYLLDDKLIAGGHSLAPGKNMNFSGQLPNKSTRVRFKFAGGGQLFFNDQRKFGYLKIVSAAELEIIKEAYGLEPLDKKFTPRFLTQILKKRRRNIKAVLLDQKIMAGVGNIYADEVLFRSRINPQRLAGDLRPAEITLLAHNLRSLLKQAIVYRGTTFSDYLDAQGKKGNFSRLLQVYGRTGEPCMRCGRPITKIRVAGRGTHICSDCQK